MLAFCWNRRTEWAALTWKQFKHRELEGDHVPDARARGSRLRVDRSSCIAGTIEAVELARFLPTAPRQRGLAVALFCWL